MTPAFSQKAFRDLQLTLADFNDQHQGLDSNANAVIIFDKGEAVYDNSGCKLTRNRRLRILTKQGLDEWGKVVGFYPRGATSKLEVAVFNIEGGVVSKSIMDLDFAFETNYDKYTDKMACAFPNVKVGSIVEYRYTVKYWDGFDLDWKFQYEIPVLRSEYKVFYPIANGLTSVLLGSRPFTIQDKTNDGRNYRWVMVNVPPFKAEPLMPYQNQYPSRLTLWGYYESWASTCSRLSRLESFWGIVNKSFELNAKVKEITENATNGNEKVKRIVNYIKKNIEWNGVSDFLGTWPNKLLVEKRGTSGDINLMLASMLKKAGFDVSLVLLVTKDKGFIVEDIPSAYQFNYVICQVKVDDKIFYLDATDPTLPFNVLPLRCSNVKGLRLDDRALPSRNDSNNSYRPRAENFSEQNFEWLVTPAPVLSKMTGQVDLIIDQPSNNAKITYTNYFASQARTKEKVVTEFGLEVQASEIDKTSDADQPLITNCRYQTEQICQAAGELFYVTPVFSNKLSRNPLSGSRVYPLDFGYPKDETIVFSLLIPSSYFVEEHVSPKNLTVASGAMRYSVSVVNLPGKVVVTSNFRINQTSFSANQNNELKEFFDSIMEVQNSQIVLKSK